MRLRVSPAGMSALHALAGEGARPTPRQVGTAPHQDKSEPHHLASKAFPTYWPCSSQAMPVPAMPRCLLTAFRPTCYLFGSTGCRGDSWLSCFPAGTDRRPDVVAFPTLESQVARNDSKAGNFSASCSTMTSRMLGYLGSPVLLPTSRTRLAESGMVRGWPQERPGVSRCARAH